ncbi:MAG: hypothetical protein WCE52_13985, partial [Candidatus Acidiferrum sp.]
MAAGTVTLLGLYLLTGSCFHGAAIKAAQDRSVGQGSPTEALGTNSPAVGIAAQKPEAADTEKKDTKKKPAHRGSLVVAPLPIVSPAIGSGIVPVLGYIFPFRESDKVSPPSVIGAAGFVTNNGSRGFALGADLFLKENRYELKSIYGRGSVDYKLYGLGYISGSTGPGLPLEQTGQLLFVEFLRNIGSRIFVGPRFMNGDSRITVSNSPDRSGVVVPPDVGLETNLRSIGFRVIRDSRTNRFYPTDGMLIDFTGDFYSQNLGSKYSFQSYNFHFDKY